VLPRAHFPGADAVAGGGSGDGGVCVHAPVPARLHHERDTYLGWSAGEYCVTVYSCSATRLFSVT